MKINKIFSSLLVSVVYLLPASAHAADSGSSNLSIGGTAQKVCVMPDPSATNTGNASVSNMTITVDSLINDNDATVQSWEATLNYPSVMCNYAAYLKLRSLSGGLQIVGQAPIPAGGEFLDKVDYTATATWGGMDDLVLNTATNGTDPVSLQASGPNQGDLVILLQAPASTLPLIQGQYQDTLEVAVGPSM